MGGGGFPFPARTEENGHAELEDVSGQKRAKDLREKRSLFGISHDDAAREKEVSRQRGGLVQKQGRIQKPPRSEAGESGTPKG